MSIALEHTVHQLVARLTALEARVLYLEQQKAPKPETLKLKPR